MDHFRLPPGAEHYITVPYKCSEPYDNGDFHTYPRRKKWTAEDIEGIDDYGRRQPEEVEAFFQSWLFFGVLVEVFKIVDINIDTEDFIDRPRGVVTTRKLPELMEELNTAWKRLWPDVITHEFASTPKAVATTEILDTVIRIISPYCFHPRPSMPLSVRPSPLSAEVVVSIIGLATTFRSAGMELYQGRGFLSGLGKTPLLRSILQKKWCPYHATCMQIDLGLDGQYYIGALPGLRKTELERHSECTNTLCVEKHIDNDTYVLKHTRFACSGANRCHHVSIPEGDLLDVIKRNDTPIAFFIKGDGLDNKGRIEITGYDSSTTASMPYIAISHVWSDGMGNPHRNELPSCTLETIQKMVDAVNYPGRETYTNEHVGFWMDTICVPVDPRHDEYRKATIIKMRQIYQEASAVLVVDSHLSSVPSTASLADRCASLYTTNWIRRLWTYQEGGLAKRLFFQFSDKPLEGYKVFYNDTVNLNFFAPERRLENLDLQLERQLANQFSFHVRDQFHFLQGALLNWAAEGSLDQLRYGAFLPMASSFSTRMTTRQSDEAFCLASVLVLDTTPLVNVKAPEGIKSKDKETRNRADRELADQRMAVLYRLIGRFQDMIIFNKYPRLPLDGFRWGPRSYLGQLSSFQDPELVPTYKEYDHDKALVRTWGKDKSKSGLLVKFPVIDFDGLTAAQFSVGDDQRVILDTGGGNPSDSVMTNPELQPGRYLIEPSLDMQSKPQRLFWDVSAHYCLVMPLPRTKRVIGATKVAVLGQLLPWKRATRRIRHNCLVRVTLLHSQHGTKPDDFPTVELRGVELPECPVMIV